MENLILIVHVLLALSVVALVLLQQGKGADMGASFGSGASQTVFGSSGSGNFLTRTTAVLATLFFVTSFGLAIVAKEKSMIQTNAGIPEAVIVQPAELDVLPEISDDVPPVSAGSNTDLPKTNEK